MQNKYEPLRVGKAFYFASSILLTITASGLIYYSSANAIQKPSTIRYEYKNENKMKKQSTESTTSTIESRLDLP